MKYAIFFERDGMLNHVQVKSGHPITPLRSHEFEVNEAAVGPLHELSKAGYLLLATTNQPGISLGTVPRRELDTMHEVLKHRLHLDDVLVCPHDSGDQCNCRKPKPGLMFEAAFKWH